MSQVRGARTGVNRRGGGYADRYLKRWLRTLAITLGVLIAVDILLIVLADGILPSVLLLAFPVAGSLVNLVVALPRTAHA